MKSVSSIASRYQFDIKKLNSVIAEMADKITPTNIGKTVMLASHDIEQVVSTYRSKFQSN